MCGSGKTRRHRAAGAGAGGADSCGRGRAAAAQAGRGGARAQSAGEGALSARRGGRRRAAQLRARHRLGAAPRHFRADGGVRLIRMLKPPRLRPGDRVAIVAPASSFIREEFDKGVAEIERLGFEPVFDESVFAQHGGYLSGDGQRPGARVSRGVARSVRCARSSPCAAATAACICFRFSNRRICGRRRRPSSGTATSRPCSRT